MVAYIFDATKGETPATLAQKRAVAKALVQGQRSPQNVGEGISALGDGIVARVLSDRADSAEAAGMASANDAFAPIIAALGGGEFPAAPAAPRQQSPAVSTMDPLSTEAATGQIPPNNDLRSGILETAKSLGIDPVDLATAISYETGGTFDPLKRGPTTQWGQHRGLIQFGEPQAKEHGVDWNNPLGSQLGPNGAVASYLRKSGVTPGMGLLDVYSAINAGAPGRYNRSDANNGGAPGTVRDKVERQMAGHRQKALALIGDAGVSPAATALDNLASGGVQVASMDPSAGVMEAGAEQGIPADNPGLQALAKLKSGGMTQVAQALSGSQSDAPPEMAGNAPAGAMPSIAQLLAAGGNPFMPEGNQKIINMLIEQEMQRRDPAYKLGLEKSQLEVDAMRNPRMSPSERANYDLNVEKFGAENAQRMWDREYKGREFGLKEREFSSVDADRTADNTRADSELAIKQLEYMLKTQPDFYAKYTAQEEAAGRQPLGILDYAKQLKQAGAGNTNVTIGGEPNDSALRKKLDEKTGELWSAYQQTGATSAAMGQDMQILDELIKVAPQGPVTGRLAEMFPGVSSAGDAFQAIVKRMAPTLRAPGSGATSDIEYDGMLKSLPALRNKPEANMAISQIIKAKAALNVERSGVIDAYGRGELSAGDARARIAEIDKRSIMTPELTRSLEGVGVVDDQAPQGVDPEDWKYLTPEERKLFQ